MSDFNNRVAAQRELLRLVNNGTWCTEELFSLSGKAIDRWIAANRLDSASKLVELVRFASEKLLFLANKSQEQISEEYKLISREFSSMAEAIRTQMTQLRSRSA
jgi:hypothetical protein